MKQIISIFILVFGFGFSVFAQTEQTSCPRLDVSGGGVVRPGESMIFTVNVAGLSDASTLKYEWEISNGTISSGPGTPVITVDTTGLSNTEITAKVKVAGLPESCANTASETGAVVPIIDPRLFDEFGKLSNIDILVRIQNLFVELGNNNEAQAIIFNYGTENEIAARERQIQNAIKNLRLDSSRVKIVNGGANVREKGVWTKVWLMSRGSV